MLIARAKPLVRPIQLSGLVAAVGEARVAVVALGPERRPAKMRGQPLQPMHRRGAEEKRVTVEGVEVHGSILVAASSVEHVLLKAARRSPRSRPLPGCPATRWPRWYG